jgi:hypothetical protein
MESFVASASHAFRETVSPTIVSIPPSHLRLLDRVFNLADSTDPNSGRQISLLFVPDGMIKQPGSTKRGREELSDRKSSWDIIVSRHHEVLNVFASEEKRIDLMMHRRVALGMKDGTMYVREFATRTVLVKYDGGLS